MNKVYISNASRSLGYGDLTEEKHEAVTHFVSGQDVFISLPTGAGKSFCYALLPFVFDFIRTSDKPDSRLHHSIVMVVSPLKSLMEDQVAKFSSRGMKCASVGSDDLRTKEGILAGHYQLIFISAEAMLTDLTWREMFSARVKLVIHVIMTSLRQEFGLSFQTTFFAAILLAEVVGRERDYRCIWIFFAKH